MAKISTEKLDEIIMNLTSVQIGQNVPSSEVRKKLSSLLLLLVFVVSTKMGCRWTRGLDVSSSGALAL